MSRIAHQKKTADRSAAFPSVNLCICINSSRYEKFERRGLSPSIIQERQEIPIFGLSREQVSESYTVHAAAIRADAKNSKGGVYRPPSPKDGKKSRSLDFLASEGRRRTPRTPHNPSRREKPEGRGLSPSITQGRQEIPIFGFSRERVSEAYTAYAAAIRADAKNPKGGVYRPPSPKDGKKSRFLGFLASE